MNKTPKILFLARWYPNRYDPMFGLFIKRHAEAVRNFCEVGVVYTHVVEDENIKGFEIDLQMINNIPTACVYYNNSSAPIIDTLLNAFRFYKANRLGIKKIRTELGGFNLIHIHILTRLGLIGLWYKWFKGIPFIVSEHWSRYLDLTGNFTGGLRKWATQLVVKNAAAITTVSKNLANAMQKHKLLNKDYIVLPNVVTEDFLRFNQRPKSKNRKITFIHVSCFEDKSKNISGLLNVIKSLADKRNDFVFNLVGDGIDFDYLKSYAVKLRLKKEIVLFTGLLEGQSLVKEMASADMMVVFSNYENFPVVINESFALGIPVIATAVGGIPEYVDKTNGRLINAADEKMLEKQLTAFLDGHLKFNTEKFKSEARKAFSPEEVGKQLYMIYENKLPAKK